MVSCKEFVLDDVMAITAIPVTSYNLGAAAWQLTPIIPGGSFAPPLSSSVTIGLQPASAGRPVIPIMRNTGKAKDDESDSVAGRLHTVTVTCEIDERDPSVWNYLLTLERTPSHLLLSFRDNSHAFIISTKDSYICTTDREGSKTTVTFIVHNYMGIQMIV